MLLPFFLFVAACGQTILFEYDRHEINQNMMIYKRSTPPSFGFHRQ